MKDKNQTFYKAILSYKGTNYSGWQFQTENSNTVQAEVERVIASILNYQNFQIIAASRTDSGVHAQGQLLKIILPKNISPSKLLTGLNTKLPRDIRFIDIQYIEESFNVNQSITSKEYHYYFTSSKNPMATLSDIVYFCPDKLDIELMRKACDLIRGEHHFSSFTPPGKEDNNVLRKVIHCSIDKTSFLPIFENIFYLNIQAKGFLKYMVRFLMNSLLQVGKKQISLEQFKALLDADMQINNSTKASPVGLHLIRIHYDRD